jgi:hypothetical protein
MMFVLAVAFGCQAMAQGGTASRDEAIGTALAACAPLVASKTGAPAVDPRTREKNRKEANSAGQDGVTKREEARLGAQGNGPTVLLSYEQGASEKNPIQSFMYFVPLISPVDMDRQINADNTQQVAVLSYEKKVTSKSFSVNCEYEIKGRGFNRYTFDPAGMIALKIEESKKPKPDALTNLLDYIHFEGDGVGTIQIKGTINGSVQTVTEVELGFDGRGCKSPVVIGLYELKPKDGRFGYENRSNQIVARVNSLTFRKSDNPKMGITVACISKKATTGGFFGHLKAAIANLFIKPVRVTPLGNQTLLDFGYALFEQKSSFTFPRAANLKEAVVVAAEPAGDQVQGN